MARICAIEANLMLWLQPGQQRAKFYSTHMLIQLIREIDRETDRQKETAKHTDRESHTSAAG